jgi:hypothetical protein
MKLKTMGVEKERKLPVRTLHEFLFEISEAWDRFRTGSLVNMVISGILIVVLIPRVLALARGRDFVESLIFLSIIVGLSYNLWISWKQHEFYKKWEKRIGFLMHEEEYLLEDNKKTS